MVGQGLAVLLTECTSLGRRKNEGADRVTCPGLLPEQVTLPPRSFCSSPGGPC